MSIYPLSYLPISFQTTTPITFDSDYISHLLSLRVTDYFLPTQFQTNPLFAKVDEFHQNAGILQTATDALDRILTIVDVLKTNPPENIVDTLTKEINEIINNTTFNDTNVFSSVLNLNDKEINLSIPVYTPDIDINDYEKLLLQKQEDIFDALRNLSFNLPFSQNVDINKLYEFSTLSSAFNLSSINPEIVNFLLQG